MVFGACYAESLESALTCYSDMCVAYFNRQDFTPFLFRFRNIDTLLGPIFTISYLIIFLSIFC
jgi:hypothetical protein